MFLLEVGPAMMPWWKLGPGHRDGGFRTYKNRILTQVCEISDWFNQLNFDMTLAFWKVYSDLICQRIEMKPSKAIGK